jgi:hypothetical protein
MADRLSKETEDDWEVRGRAFPHDPFEPRDVSENPANPDQYVPVKPLRLVIVKTLDDLENLRSIVKQGRERIESVEGLGSFNGKPLSYAVRLSKLEPHEKDDWGDSFYEYAARVFPTISKNPSPLFKSGGYIVVKTYTGGRQEFTDHIETLEEARKFRKYFLEQNEKMLKYRGRSLFSSVEILPHTEILRNPPLSSHGSSIKTKRTHGLSLAEMRALYKLVKQGNMAAIGYARKKLEVPHSENKVQLLAVIDHHIRDLAG